MKHLSNLFSYVILLFLTGFLPACLPSKSQCPGYYNQNSGKTLSIQDGFGKDASLSPDQIQAQSVKMLDEQGTYIRTKRNKKTGLVASNKKSSSKKKPINLTHKGFSKDPGVPVGIDLYKPQPKK